MDFFVDHAVAFALVCALVAVVYGLYLTWWLLSQPAGNERMQEIARAIQEGAAAYLRKQYTTIAVVAIAPFFLLGFYNELGVGDGVRVPHRRGLLRRRGLHRDERRRALERAHRRGRTRRPAAGVQDRVQGRLRHRAPCRRSRPLRRRRLLLGAHRLAREQPRVRGRRPDRSRAWRLADLGFRAARRRHLHEGRGRRADLVGKIEAGIPEDDPRNPAVIADNVGDNVGDCAGMAATSSRLTR